MSRPKHRFTATVIFTTALAACSAAPTPDTRVQGGPAQAFQTQSNPPDVEPGTCWGKATSPAVIETVTEQVVLRPATLADDGSVISPAVIKTETQQKIVQEREETWFQILCDADLTPELIASVQRALAARDLYAGAVSGTMDARTRAAVRRYQSAGGLDSGILSLEAARQMGLVRVELDS